MFTLWLETVSDKDRFFNEVQQPFHLMKTKKVGYSGIVYIATKTRLLQRLYMKKLFIVLLTAILLLTAGFYILIPRIIHLNATLVIGAKGIALHRNLLSTNDIARWWPGERTASGLSFNNRVYTFSQGNMTVMPVTVKSRKADISTALYLISITNDSTKLQWVGSVPIASNAFERFFTYRQARELNRDMNIILEKMHTFYLSPKNVYGYDIKTTLVMDSFLIVTSGISKGYPSTPFIYSLIGQLRNYSATQSAKQTGYPMLNITTDDSLSYDVKVALPTDKMLRSSGNILQKSMPGRNIILKTDVIGGMDHYTHALEQIKQYAEDHQLKAPAIPFYSLVTDRVAEPDSSKWLTTIYFPVMIYPK